MSNLFAFVVPMWFTNQLNVKLAKNGFVLNAFKDGTKSGRSLVPTVDKFSNPQANSICS